MKGHPDGYIAETGLLELKDMNGWAYKRLLESQGVAYEEPRHYTQMQLYMDGAVRDWCLYFATPADPGMLQGIMRGYKAYGNDYILPLYYAEIVERRDVDIRAAHARAEMIATDQLSDTPPPREFDGRAMDNKGRLAWPCGYCAHQKSCDALYS
jgi:hypothetical protein